MKQFLLNVRNMSERKFDLFFITILIVFHLLMAIQCLNFCDEVFVIASGQQIFSHPESISYVFMYYWGAFFAGVWNIFFADCGIYGFRVFNAIIITLTYYIAYRTIRPYVNKWYVLVGVIMSILAETSDVTMAIHHNSVTCLFTTSAAYFLIKGLSRDKFRYFIIGGLLLGINVFSRLTNISLVGLILCLIPYFLYTKDVKKTIRYAFIFIFGFCLGIVFVVLLMITLGHWGLFVDIIKLLASASQDPLSGHGFALLIPRYLKDYAIIAGAIFYIYLVLKYGRKYLAPVNGGFQNMIISGLLALPVIALLFRFGSIFVILHFYYAIMTICLVYTLYRYKDNKSVVYLSTLGLLIIYIQPLGGDFGIENMHSCSIRFAMPLSMGLFGKIVDKEKVEGFSKLFIFSFVAVLIMWGGYILTFHRAWYDSTSRFKYTTMPKTKLANVLLKEDYANLVDDVMLQLEKYKDGYNSLFVIGYMPLFNYLSGMQPYLQCCTPDFYSPMIVEQQIKKAEERHSGHLPIVIRGMSKGSIIEKYDPEWRNVEKKEPRNQAKYYLYEDFLQRHHYKEVWREESFAILLPSDK